MQIWRRLPLLSIPAQEVKGQPTSVYLWQLFSISSSSPTNLERAFNFTDMLDWSAICRQLNFHHFLPSCKSWRIDAWAFCCLLLMADGSYKHHLSEKKITCNYPPMPINFPRKNLIRSWFDCSISSNWVLSLSSVSLSSICKELWVLVSIFKA